MKILAAALMLAAATPLAASAGGRRSSGPVAHVSRGSFVHSSPGLHGFASSHSLAAPGSAVPGFAAHQRSLRGSTRYTYASSRGLTVSRWMFSRGSAHPTDGGSGTGAGASGSGSGGSSGGSSTPTDPPPYGTFGTIPGALIRSEGLGFLYAPTGEEGRFHSVEAGDRISLDENRAVTTSGQGAFIGARDTPPGANGIASGGNAITPNQ